MEIITTASPRVWAVCAFRFWDTDLNSVISSGDIFQKFKELDALKSYFKESNSSVTTFQSIKIVDSLLHVIDTIRSIMLE